MFTVTICSKLPSLSHAHATVCFVVLFEPMPLKDDL